jgi:hypothetical protein
MSSEGERVFGSADDFYRIRVIRVDEPDELEWQWRDDVLYRRLPAEEQGSTPRYRIDAVSKDDDGTARQIAEVDTPDAAQAIAEAADEDLAQFTKRQFDAKYGLEPAP